jgi:hypothetical protein
MALTSSKARPEGAGDLLRKAKPDFSSSKEEVEA